MLTQKQKDLLLLINRRLQADGVSPSFDEMKVALGLRSKSGIHRLITGLEDRGFIKRMPHRARAIEILRLPEGGVAQGQQEGKGGRRTVPTKGGILNLPLYGRIAAGTPIEAISDPQNQVEIPASLLAFGKTREGAAADHYVLEVAGDSMREAGILDGDRVIIRRTSVADNGTIVVALVQDQEATLKYFFREQGGVRLIPANANYPALFYPADSVKVQGRVVGLLRVIS